MIDIHKMNYELLADVAQVLMGQSPPSSTYNTVGEGLPFYQGKTDFGDMYPTPRVYCTEPSRIAEAGDILISVRAPVGPTNVSQERSCIGRGISAIRVGKKLDRDFLLYFLRFYEPELAKAGTGSTFTAIAREDLETIKIPLPPLTEQKRIASLLARADRLRQLRRTAHDLGDALLQSVFLEMFGDIAINPKGWDIATLEDLETDFIYGTSQKCFSEPKGLPVLRIPNILHGSIDLEDLKYAEVPEKEAKNILLKHGDIIFVRTNGNPDYVGRCAVFNLDKDLLFASYLIRARVDLSKINPVFLLNFLQTAKGREAMAPYIRTTAGQSNIGIEGLGQIPVPVPPLSLQEEFAGVVARVESLRGRMGESTRQVEGLFESLLSQSFGQ